MEKSAIADSRLLRLAFFCGDMPSPSPSGSAEAWPNKRPMKESKIDAGAPFSSSVRPDLPAEPSSATLRPSGETMTMLGGLWPFS